MPTPSVIPAKAGIQNPLPPMEGGPGWGCPPLTLSPVEGPLRHSEPHPHVIPSTAEESKVSIARRTNVRYRKISRSKATVIVRHRVAHKPLRGYGCRVMNRNREYVTKEDLRYEIDRLSNEMLSHYATKKDLSDLKVGLFKATAWLMGAAASFATSAIVIIEHITAK